MNLYSKYIGYDWFAILVAISRIVDGGWSTLVVWIVSSDHEFLDRRISGFRKPRRSIITIIIIINNARERLETTVFHVMRWDYVQSLDHQIIWSVKTFEEKPRCNQGAGKAEVSGRQLTRSK